MSSISPPLVFDNCQGFATASLVAQMVKNPPAMWETWVQSPGWGEFLEMGMATHSSIIAWRIPMDKRSLAGHSPWCGRVRNN